MLVGSGKNQLKSQSNTRHARRISSNSFILHVLRAPVYGCCLVAPKAHFENPAPSQSRICGVPALDTSIMVFEERFGAVTLNQSTSGFFYRLIHGRNCSKPSRNRAALKIFLGNGLLQVGGRHLKSDTLLVAKMSAKPVY